MLSVHRKRGIAYLWVVVTVLMVVAFIGLAADVGYLVLVGQQLQVGADAAALAGCRLVRSDISAARAAAQDIAQQNNANRAAIKLDLNTANSPDGDIVVGRFDRATATFTPTTTSANALKVLAHRHTGETGAIQFNFGSILGLNTVDISRDAIAMAGGGTGSGLIVLDPHAPNALYVSGNATLQVNGGDIQVNSDSPQAVVLKGSFEVDAPAMNIVGGISEGKGNVGGMQINTGAPAVADPLGYLPEPTWNPAANKGTISASKTYDPGYYAGGISTSGGTINLNPGIYVLGGGINISGNARINGSGVMLYVDHGAVNLSGGPSVTLTPPDPDNYSYPGVDTYEGVTLYQAHDDTSAASLSGNAGLNMDGTLYFPNAKVNLGGNSAKLGSQFIAGQIELSGNANLTINYTGAFPAAGNKIFLVH